MNTSTYTYLLANPQKITSEDLAELDVIIKKYPFFQSAHALQLKGLKNQGSFLYNDALKITAAHTTDRDILFEYITSEKFTQNEISQLILQHDTSVDGIKVVSENVSEQISLEIDKQLKVEIQKAEAILNPELFERKLKSVTNIAEEKKTTPVEIQENPEEILQVDKPLEFTKNDTHSFAEWLKLTKVEPINRLEKTSEATEKEEFKNEKERKLELINKFIQNKPKISPSESVQNKNVKNESKTLSAPYTQTPDSLMTETLAKIYLQQNNYKKAIQAYKILILKNPEKSGFFADQIQAIEKLINT